MDTYQWTLAAEQDLATWIAVSGTSLPYNLAHVIGNVVFCLLIGPGLLRALSRYRRRFEVRWAPAAAAAGAVLLLLLALPAGASAASASKRATAWLAKAQNSDGGFGSAAGQASGRALHRLGVARPGGGRAQPARRRAPRPQPDRLHPHGRATDPRGGGGRAHDPRASRPPACPRATSAGATSSRG